MQIPSLFQESDGARAFRIIVEAVVFALGTFGNVMVCAVTCQSRNMRTVGNLFILHLAISDLGTILIFFPFVVVRMDFPYSWPFGEFVCKYLYPLADIFTGIMVGCITAISYHRYRMLVHYMKPQMTHKTARRIVLFVWAISFAMIVFPEFFVMELKITPERADCTAVWPNEVLKKIYLFLNTVVFYFLPLGFIFVSYLRIRTHLRTNIKKHRSSRRTSHRAKSSRKGAFARVAQNKRAIRLLTPVLITFATCFFPRIVFIYYVETIENPRHHPNIRVFFNITAVLILINSAADPIIYSFFNTDFRQEFNRMLYSKALGREKETERQQLKSKKIKNSTLLRERLLISPKKSSLLLERKELLPNKAFDKSSKDSSTSKKQLGSLEDPDCFAKLSQEYCWESSI